jgi:hypothetical protein
MSDNFKLCESCNTQFDDSCLHVDDDGLWFCDGCWYDRIDEERRSHAQREALINRFRDFQGPGERSP